MSDQTLLILTKEVRGKTLRILDQVTEDQARFSPPGLQNTILWHAGHSLVVVEHLSVSAATGKPPVYPDGWFDKFKWGGEPAKVTSWPTLSEVKAKLIEQAERLTVAINALSEDQLSQITGDPAKNRTLRWSILHGLHDEAGHQGEMWLLKKLQTPKP
jgi:hypothetical protein